MVVAQHRSFPRPTGTAPVTVLNVAEKPSVARALAQVFSRMPSPTSSVAVRDAGMQRDVHQIFTHENVHFPNVYTQGDGQTIQGPSTFDSCAFSKLDSVFLLLFAHSITYTNTQLRHTP
jgi:hypothetical protein